MRGSFDRLFAGVDFKVVEEVHRSPFRLFQLSLTFELFYIGVQAEQPPQWPLEQPLASRQCRLKYSLKVGYLFKQLIMIQADDDGTGSSYSDDEGSALNYQSISSSIYNYRVENGHTYHAVSTGTF